MFNAKDVAVWFLLKNNSEIKEHEAENDDYEVYEGITHLKLQKLLYYAQGIHLALYNEPLFIEHIVAWQHGPVVEEVYDIYKENGRNIINIGMSKENEEILNSIENDRKACEALNLTYNNFAIYTAWQLRQMTHEDGTPWDITEREYGLNNIIPNELISEYFKREVIE